MRVLVTVMLGFLFLTSCQEDNAPLPILGHLNIQGKDTILHSIPDFSFMNQDSAVISNADLKNYIYISDFFFISCPSICPIVKKQMLRVYEKYKDNDRVKLVSHTIDPKRDTPEKLKQYAAKLNIDTEKWIFLTGEKGEILDIADDYFVSAYEDSEAPGGFDHSGKMILTDTNRHIRAFAEGTDPKDVDQLLKDIDKLLAEYEN